MDLKVKNRGAGDCERAPGPVGRRGDNGERGRGNAKDSGQGGGEGGMFPNQLISVAHTFCARWTPDPGLKHCRLPVRIIISGGGRTRARRQGGEKLGGYAPCRFALRLNMKQ